MISAFGSRFWSRLNGYMVFIDGSSAGLGVLGSNTS